MRLQFSPEFNTVYLLSSPICCTRNLKDPILRLAVGYSWTKSASFYLNNVVNTYVVEEDLSADGVEFCRCVCDPGVSKVQVFPTRLLVYSYILSL